MSLVALIGGLSRRASTNLNRSLKDCIDAYLSFKESSETIIQRLKGTTEEGDFTSILLNYKLDDDSDGEELLYLIAGLYDDGSGIRERVQKTEDWDMVITRREGKMREFINTYFNGDFSQYIDFVDRYSQADLILIGDRGTITETTQKGRIKIIPDIELERELIKLSGDYAPDEMGYAEATGAMVGLDSDERQVPNLADLVPGDDPISPYHSDELPTD